MMRQLRPPSAPVRPPIARAQDFLLPFAQRDESTAPTTRRGAATEVRVNA